MQSRPFPRYLVVAQTLKIRQKRFFLEILQELLQSDLNELKALSWVTEECALCAVRVSQDVYNTGATLVMNSQNAIPFPLFKLCLIPACLNRT
jgi:hypothetical protein